MGGFTEDKKFITLEGERNCGKGVISDILINAFEQYITLSNSNNLLMKNNKADKDEAKALSWTLALEFTRLCLFQEMSVDPEKPVKLDSSMIKKISSGGDKISARSNNKDEREFNIQSTILICTNDFPEATTSDFKETKDEFIIKSKFVDKKFKEEDKKKDMKYYNKDDTIKEYITNKDILNEFIIMILSASVCEYPELIKEENNELEKEDDFTKIKQLFEVTKDKEDTLTNKDLTEYVKSFKLPFTVIKLKRNLVSLGAETYRRADERGLSYIKLKE